MNNNLKETLQNNLRQYALFLAFVMIIIVFQIWTNGILLKPQNVTNLIQQNSYILILAIGMLMTIISGGHIDLSVGSVGGFIGSITAKLCIVGDMNPWLAIMIGLLTGLAIGAVSGYFIAYRNVPSFIVTLAGMLVYRGLSLATLAGRTLAPFPPAYQIVSTGFLPDFFNYPGLHLTSILIGVFICPVIVFFQLRDRAEMKKNDAKVTPLSLFIAKQIAIFGVVLLFTYWLALYRGIPSILVLLTVIFLIYNFFTTQTVFGRHLYAMGGNRKAAELSGINTKRLLFFAFVNLSFLAAISGIVFAGRLNAATPKAGGGWELDAIAACFIGGASASGGVGTIGGAIIGGLIMGVLNNGMSIVGIDVDWQHVIKGIVLLIAVLFDVYSRNRVKVK
jgi:putative multiple sugar transport system permease protein